jgi:hypothetical protein
VQVLPFALYLSLLPLRCAFFCLDTKEAKNQESPNASTRKAILPARLNFHWARAFFFFVIPKYEAIACYTGE